jgi:hypothetical protein
LYKYERGRILQCLSAWAEPVSDMVLD